MLKPAKEMIVCSGHYTNQALRTLKVCKARQSNGRYLRERPKITLADAPGRDRIIDERAEDHLEEAYSDRPTSSDSDCVNRLGWS